MRFVLVETRGDHSELARIFHKHGWRSYRATYAGDTKTVDVFFWSLSTADAKAIIRKGYPLAQFSDEIGEATP